MKQNDSKWKSGGFKKIKKKWKCKVKVKFKVKLKDIPFSLLFERTSWQKWDFE